MTGVVRCAWADGDAIMAEYHDTEWGVPIYDSRGLWEMLVLEGFQAGLSWRTILRRREGFQSAFVGFDPVAVASFGDADIERLMRDASIIRARAKIEATIQNARAYLAMAERGQDFSDWCWSKVDGEPLFGDGVSMATQTPLSAAISKELKELGFKFIGAVTAYAWMQAVGLIDDHAASCYKRLGSRRECTTI